MKAFKVINNQSGMMAMMGAMIFTIAITTTLSTFYVYTLNQAKYHARIKEAYQLINIMESFATATRKAYDMGMSARANGIAEGAPCIAGGSSVLRAVTGTTDKFYCQPQGETCFTREDVNEQYCTAISFTASNVEIKKQKSYAEIKTDSFLKKWRLGLNNFYVSPAIKDRIVDTSTMAYVIRKPQLLDWLTSTAHATDNHSGESNYPESIGSPMTANQGSLLENTPTSPDSPTESGQAASITCSPNYTVRICNLEVSSTQPGGSIQPPVYRCNEFSDPNVVGQYCSDCSRTGQFCSSAGNSEGNGGIRVERGEDSYNLPVMQRYSIVM